MKRIYLLLISLIMISGQISAQTQTINGQLKLKNVPLGSLKDSILMIGPDGAVRHLQSSILKSNPVDLSAYQPKSEKGKPNGYVSLDATGKVPASQLPVYINSSRVFQFVASGDGIRSEFRVPHGLSAATMVILMPNSPDAIGYGVDMNTDPVNAMNLYSYIDGPDVVIKIKDVQNIQRNIAFNEGTNNLIWTILVL